MPPSTKKPSRFHTFVSAVRNFGHDSHSDNWGMQVKSPNRSSYDDAHGHKRLESTERKKNHSRASDPATKPVSELRKSRAGTTRADSYNNLQRDRDSEDYQSSDQEHGGAVLNNIQNVTGCGDVSAEAPARSEAEVVDDIVQRVPQLSRPGREKVLSALFKEPSSDAAESLAWIVFKDLHSLFPGCTPTNKAKAAMEALYQEKNELLDKYKSMHSSLCEANSALLNEQNRVNTHKKRAESRLNEVHNLQLKVEELNNLHIRSMNGIGAGIDPITDQNFSIMLENHHKNSNHWCRKNFGGGGRQLGDTYDQLSDPLKTYFTAQCHESVVLHDSALKPWFPVNIPMYADYSWEGVQASFSKSDDPEHQQRVEFWRGYTACLAFKSLDFQAAIDAKVEHLLSDFVPFVTQLLQPAPPKVNVQALKKIIRAVYITAAEMKCQRGHYEIEQIPVGAEFDEDFMENANKVSDLEDKITHYVRVVLSEGIVKRPYRGSSEEVGRVWAPQVFVGEKTEEIVPDQRGDRREGTVVDGEDVIMS